MAAAVVAAQRPSRYELLNPAIAGPMFYREMKDRDRRKTFYAIFAGKMLGLAAMGAVAFALIWYFGAQAMAQDATSAATVPGSSPLDVVNPINTMWTLVTAFLVFFMQAGFMFLEAGFARERETVN